MVGDSGASFTCDFAWVGFSVHISHTLSALLWHTIVFLISAELLPPAFPPINMLFLCHNAFLGSPINSDLCIPYELVNLVGN